MMTLEGYKFSENLYKGTRTEVYRGTRTSDNKPVIIKVLRNPHPNFNELVQFRNQYVITRNLEHKAIVRPLALERYGNGYALVMPDDGAIGLEDYWPRSDRSLTESIAIAMQLADALHYLTRQRIVHKDIKPANILIHPETRKVKLIDFSISSLLPREQQQLLNPNVLEGTLAYISPEQTGRMNRGIDYRTDFYSVGVTFFELLTGQLPFATTDPMELVHCHIAQGVQFPSTSGVDEVVQGIVLKLMAKNAEDRYQSALGLKHDLERCLQQLSATGEITPFDLGERDMCDRFIIPEKLYGREAEVQRLLDGFDRVSAGATIMMLVAGFSGIGKTAVVSEVHKPIVRQRGYFIKGKFDQFNRNIPFSAFVQAFRDLMRQLLGEPDAELEEWKGKILEAVGVQGQVIIDVIPELERIIGKQPPAPELSGSAAQNRFNLLFEKFIAVFTTKEHPLTIFVDDLQWADSASLNLMKVLMGDSQTGYLLLLGAYRDNEVFPAHPLMLSLAELEKQQTTIATITLAPLSIGHINQLVAETLGCMVELATTLTDLVYQNTRGNPFFTTQLLKGLHDDGLITFNHDLGYWEWDLVKIQDAALTDDVVEFMAARLHKLPIATQELLKLAACIGNQFDLETLAVVCEAPVEEVAIDIWSALPEELILPISEAYKFFQGEMDSSPTEMITVNYRFLHDRVQQAAYSLISQSQKQVTHLKIGQLLLSNYQESEGEDNLFDIVNQLNIGHQLILGQTERNKLARLNLQAGRKAKASTAYSGALEYLRAGIKLLAAESWQSEYELTLALYIEATESSYLNAEFEEAENYTDYVLEQVNEILDAVKLYELKIHQKIAEQKAEEALEIGLQTLNYLGISREHILDYGQRPIVLPQVENLKRSLEMTNPYQLALMRLLVASTTAALSAKPELLPAIIATQIHLSLEKGNSSLAAFSYSWYGSLRCGTIAGIDEGYQAGQLALELLDLFETGALKSQVMNMVYNSSYSWKNHLKQTLLPLLDAFKIGRENGELIYASYGVNNYCINAFLIGHNLQNLLEQQTFYVEALQKHKIAYTINKQLVWKQLNLNLQGLVEDLYELTGEAIDENIFLKKLPKIDDLWSLFSLHIAKEMLLYLLGDYAKAAVQSVEAEKYSFAVGGWPPIGIHNFYKSLSLLALYPNADQVTQKQYFKQVAANQEKLQIWAEKAPMNYQHKYHLVEAELYRVLGNKIEAIELYDRAIASAKANEYIQEEALANELAAKFYLDWGKEKIAPVYMQEAYYCYARWGAKAKTDQLERKYPQLLHPILQQASPTLDLLGTLTSIYSNKSTVSSTGTQTSQTNANTALDLLTILKASQAISSTIEIDELLGQLTQIILQISGGDRCAIVLCELDSQVRVRAIATAEGTELEAIALKDASHLPVQLIQYVKHTSETLVMDSPDRDLPVGDRYLAERQPQSVLCMPLVERNRLRGVLYLENLATKGVFQGQRLVALNLLATTAAIALENARLYQQALYYARELEESQLQLVQSEKMSALGNLVAGVAHEINNPVGFIAGNLDPARDYLEDLFGLIDLYQQEVPHPSEAIQAEISAIDLEFLRSDLPQLISSMREGTDRIEEISTSLRTFSRTDKEHKVPFDIHQGIESTLLILKHRTKAKVDRPAIEIVKDYGELPEVQCFPGQLNQVFMNLIANAIDALEEANRGRSFAYIAANPNRIVIKTQGMAEQVTIRIADNGTGMPEDVKQRIFEQGFTTKAVGKGTGLGMAIAKSIVKEKHGGAIACQSQLGKGTEFIISLPLS